MHSFHNIVILNLHAFMPHLTLIQQSVNIPKCHSCVIQCHLCSAVMNFDIDFFLIDIDLI